MITVTVDIALMTVRKSFLENNKHDFCVLCSIGVGWATLSEKGNGKNKLNNEEESTRH